MIYNFACFRERFVSFTYIEFILTEKTELNSMNIQSLKRNYYI